MVLKSEVAHTTLKKQFTLEMRECTIAACRKLTFLALNRTISAAKQKNTSLKIILVFIILLSNMIQI